MSSLSFLKNANYCFGLILLPAFTYKMLELLLSQGITQVDKWQGPVNSTDVFPSSTPILVHFYPFDDHANNLPSFLIYFQARMTLSKLLILKLSTLNHKRWALCSSVIHDRTARSKCSNSITSGKIRSFFVISRSW